MILFPLVWKDLEQHRKSLLLYSLSVIMLPIAFEYFTKKPDISGFAGILIGYMGFGGPMLLALWLIGQERVKGTLRILRILPVPPASIITTKVAESSTICLLLLNTVLFLDPVVLHLISGKTLSVPLIVAFWFNFGVILSSTLCCCAFTLLDHKIAMQACYWVLFGLAGSVVIAQKIAVTKHLQLSELPQRFIMPIGASIILAASIILTVVAARVFSWKDWSDLEEN